MKPLDMPTAELEKIASQIRYKLVKLSYSKKTPHLGSSLSCVDILVSAYFSAISVSPQKPLAPNRDRLILSKGHAAAALYTTLCYRGFFPVTELENYAKNGSKMAEHPSIGSVPGIEAATGSLGHGLPIGVGMAITSKVKKQPFRVFVVMGDGECNEGSVWEAALVAPKHYLDNLVVLIDFNKWQATGRSQEITSIDPLKEKWDAFGWSTYEVNGHDIQQLNTVMSTIPIQPDKPTAIIAHTIKGKGVSFMEDDNNWHYRIPTRKEVEKAKSELK